MQFFGTKSGLSTLLLLAFALFALSASALPQPQDDEGGDGVDGVEEFSNDDGSDDVTSSAVKGKKWKLTPYQLRRKAQPSTAFQCDETSIKQGDFVDKKPRGCRNLGFSLDAPRNGFDWDGDGAFKLCIWKDKNCKELSKGFVKKVDCAKKGTVKKGQAYSVIKASKKC